MLWAVRAFTKLGRSASGIAVLLALITLAQIQRPLAHLGIVWRVVLLSWDDPATQTPQDLATETIPQAEPGREINERMRATVQHGTSMLRPTPDRRSEHPATTGRITRSPPAA